MTDKTVIEQAIEKAGSEAKLGAGTGFSQVAINKAKKRGRASPDMALKIHRFLHGAISASDLCPGVWATREDAERAAELPADPEQSAGAAAARAHNPTAAAARSGKAA